MKLAKTLKLTVLTSLLTAVTIATHAHSPFIAPQAYVVDGETAAVLGGYAEAPFASEFAISGFDMSVISPQGEAQALQPQATKHLTTADVLTKEEGTYKVIAQKESSIEYAQIGGQWYRVMEAHTDKVPPLAERSFAQPSEVPAKAKKATTTSYTQLVSYFSRGKLSNEVLAVTAKGLNVQFSTHPNALKSGQPLTLTLTSNGKVQANYELVALKQLQSVDEKEVEIEAKSDKNGQIQLTFPAAGQYILEISSPSTDKKVQPAAQSYRQNIAISVN